MSDVKHTPGPWEYDWGQKRDGVVENWIVGPVDGNADINTIVSIANDYEGAENTAHLIAAAPELLEALKALTPSEANSDDWWCPQCEGYVVATFSECCDTCGTLLTDCQPPEEWHTKALAAIAKAEGKTNE